LLAQRWAGRKPVRACELFSEAEVIGRLRVDAAISTYFVLRPLEHLLQALAARRANWRSISRPLTSITKQGI